MLGRVLNIFRIPDLRKKILFTIGLLVIYRIGFHIPIPGFDTEAIQQAMGQAEGGAMGRIADYLQMFTGGTLSKSSLFGLGIMPYITSSIIFMLLGEIVPALHKLRQEGQAGHKKIQEYTRYLTVPICLLQGTMYMRLLGDYVYPGMRYQALIMGMVGMTAGTIFLMWLGEQIDEYGIGNGISLLIMAGIVSRMPGAIQEVASRVDFRATAGADKYGPTVVVFLIAAFVFVVAGAIFITQGQRRIPIQQAKQMRGRRMYGGQRHYLPLRVNHGGVMPVIFASSFMMFPPLIFQFLGRIPLGSGWQRWMSHISMNELSPGAYFYSVLYILLIFLFAYFWTSVQFQPRDMAKRLRDTGSFIPGLRPGNRTAEYLETVMSRITFFGAAFLSFIAVVPGILANTPQIGISWRVSSFLGGTGLLIVVSVSLDLVQRIEANLIMRNYEGFSDSGRIKGAYS